jgi:hypothetical protein
MRMTSRSLELTGPWKAGRKMCPLLPRPLWRNQVGVEERDPDVSSEVADRRARIAGAGAARRSGPTDEPCELLAEVDDPIEAGVPAVSSPQS